MPKTTTLALSAFAGLGLLISAAPAMADPYLLELDGIRGEAPDKVKPKSEDQKGNLDRDIIRRVVPSTPKPPKTSRTPQPSAPQGLTLLLPAVQKVQAPATPQQEGQ